MKNLLLYSTFILFFLINCAPTSTIRKSEAYSGFYNERPISVLIMPPINRSTNVEAKEVFHSTLNRPIANSGYYVIPPFLSMEILKKESAYDAELFLNSSLNKFKEVFGADIVVFTIIHQWEKSKLAAKVYVEVEYLIKSTKTNELIFSRKGNVTYDATINSGNNGLVGALIDFAASALVTALTENVDVARQCNKYTLGDLPAGKYSPTFGLDEAEIAGKKEFNATVRAN